MDKKKIIKKLDILRKFDTPTICNGIEIVNSSYKLKGYTKQRFFCLHPNSKPIVGFAKTAKISSKKIIKYSKTDIRLSYYEYVNNRDLPKISLIEDVCNNPVGSFWGEVNANIHLRLGCIGVVTNGSVRDLEVIPNKFQLLSKTLSPSHAEVMLLNFGKKITVMGLDVFDNDLIHADIHGAVNIPFDYIDEIIKAIKYVSRKEKIILDSCKNRPFKFSAFKKAYIKSKKY